MGVGVEGDGDGGVAQELLHELGVDVPLKQQGSAGVPEVVECDPRQPRFLQERREGPLPNVRRVEIAALSREDELSIFI